MQPRFHSWSLVWLHLLADKQQGPDCSTLLSGAHHVINCFQSTEILWRRGPPSPEQDESWSCCFLCLLLSWWQHRTENRWGSDRLGLDNVFRMQKRSTYYIVFQWEKIPSIHWAPSIWLILNNVSGFVYILSLAHAHFTKVESKGQSDLLRDTAGVSETGFTLDL